MSAFCGLLAVSGAVCDKYLTIWNKCGIINTYVR